MKHKHKLAQYISDNLESKITDESYLLITDCKTFKNTIYELLCSFEDQHENFSIIVTLEEEIKK